MRQLLWAGAVIAVLTAGHSAAQTNRRANLPLAEGNVGINPAGDNKPSGEAAAPASGQTSRRAILPLAESNVITNPDWISKPSGDDVAAYYPKIAQFMSLPGRATIRCSVKEDGATTNCRVTSEAPVGIGFGQAAVQISNLFRMKPRTVNGVAVAGGEVVIPINFALGDDDAPPANDPLPRPDARLVALGRRVVLASDFMEQFDQTTNNQIKQLRDSEYAASAGADAGGQELALQAIADATKAARDSYIDQLAVVYARQFSESELVQLAAHFENPAQKLWIARQGAISKAMTDIGVRVTPRIADDARARFCKAATCLAAQQPANQQTTTQGARR